MESGNPKISEPVKKDCGACVYCDKFTFETQCSQNPKY